MESLDDISQRFDEACLVSGGLNKDGCKVVMAGVSDRIVVDFDRSGSPLATDMTRCDYLLVIRGKSKDMSGWVVVIELKRGGLDASKVIQQLQAGASVAERFIFSSEAQGFQFKPVVVCGKRNKHQLKKLRRNRIRFHECRETIRMMRCGDSLRAVLGQ